LIARALQARQRWGEAIEAYREAARLDPDNPWTHYDLGMALNTPGRQDEAIVHLEKAAALAADAVDVRLNLASALLARNRPAESIGHLRAILVAEPNNSAAQEAFRTALPRLGSLEDRQREWKKVLEAGPSQYDTWSGYAELCLFLDRRDEFLCARREQLARFGDTADPFVAERVARACLLLPGTEEELSQATSLAERATAAADSKYDWARPYFDFAKGLADYRKGQFDETIAVMSGEAKDTHYIGPSALLVTAMALHHQGKTDEARTALIDALESYDWSPAKADHRDAWIPHILRREAEALINVTEPPPSS
jgi:tetratricopeptide (TPR) repeat protein